MPPSTASVAPVTNELSSLARNSVARATSVGAACRASGMSCSNAAAAAVGDQADQADPGSLGHEGPGRGHADAALAAGDEGGLPAQQAPRFHAADAPAIIDPFGGRPSSRAGAPMVKGVRYIECGVAILAYSRQRRGPGATRRRRPSAGNR
jgi:hypothetical protein